VVAVLAQQVRRLLAQAVRIQYFHLLPLLVEAGVALIALPVKRASVVVLVVAVHGELLEGLEILLAPLPRREIMVVLVARKVALTGLVVEVGHRQLEAMALVLVAVMEEMERHHLFLVHQ
jgi:hypothetical protein